MNKSCFSRNLITTSILATAIILSGCQSTADQLVEQQQQTQENNEHFLVVKNAIDTLTTRFEEAKEADLAYFATDIFEDATDKKEDADDQFDDIRFAPDKATESKTERILSDVSSANQYLDQALLIKQSAEIVLAESFEQNKVLKELGAEKLYGREFHEAQGRLSDLVELVADGKQEKAQIKQASLLPLLFSLEIKVVKDKELGELRKRLVTLRKAQINTIAPISYEKTIGLAQSAESMISTDPKDIDAIRKSVALAIFDAKHTQNIAIEVKRLRAMKKGDYEDYILDFENKLDSVSQVLKGVDLRDEVLSEQTTRLVSQGEALNTELQQQAKKISALELAKHNKDELLQVASTDKDNLSAITQAKLVSKSEEIEQKVNEINELMLTKQTLELKVTAAEQETLIAQRKLEDLQHLQEIDATKNELALSANNLSAEKAQLTLEKKLQSLQAELSTTKASNRRLTQQVKGLNNTVANLKSNPVVTEVKAEPVIVTKVVNNQ